MLSDHLDDLFADAIGVLTIQKEKDEIRKAFSRIADRFELKHLSYLALNIPGREHRAPLIITTYAPNWVNRYNEKVYVRIDPVIQQGLSSILPVSWSEFDLSSKRLRSLFGEAAEHGVGRNGMSFPIRGRHGESALFSITSDDVPAEWDRKKRIYTRDFQTIAYHVHRLVLRIEGVCLPDVKLSSREIQCLRWIAMGKTVSETAMILTLKDRTVRYYLEIARDKLEAINTTNAVAKAISLNLLSINT